ncbi:MAG: hypothetical protein ABJC66_10235 [Gammaproteobacteria bacterium]
MNTATQMLSVAVLCCAAGVAPAQQSTPPAKPANAQAEAGEPRAGTSSPSPTPSAAPDPAVAEPHPAAAPPPAAVPKANATTTAASTTPATPAAGREAVTTRPAANKIDRLDLGTATVTGDHEEPKVMYIVPWKRSDIGDLAGKPMNSLVDEILSPVDRDVFKREVVYYRAVQADASQNGAVPKPAPQGEK